MSFIQCKDEKEAQDLADKRGVPCFITEDHRIYDSLVLMEEVGFVKIEAKEVAALLEMRDSIHMIGDPGYECGFTELVEAARYLETKFSEVCKKLRVEPTKKKRKE